MPPKGNLRRYRVGVLYNGNPHLVDAIMGLGHRTVVFSDRFRPLFKLLKVHQKGKGRLFDTTLLLETSLNALPIADKSLDVLILSNGLVCRGAAPPAEYLEGLKRLIRPEGTIIWPERISDGFLGKLSKVRHPFSRAIGPLPRRHLCRISMAAGFREIGQIMVNNQVEPWIVTFGKVGKRTYLYTA